MSRQKNRFYMKKQDFLWKKQDLIRKTGFILFAQTKKCRNPVFLTFPVFLLFWNKRKEKNRISTNPSQPC